MIGINGGGISVVKAFRTENGKARILQLYDHMLESWNTDIREVNIETKYGVTHCIIAGNKENPPLLMFHGVGDNSAVMWLFNIKDLSEHFYCIAVDTMGGPGKSIPNENCSKKKFNQIDWINEVVESLKIDNFNIVGVSNGAAIALNYAINESQKVNRVVCIEGGIVTSPIKSAISALILLLPEALIPTKRNLIKAMCKLASPKSNIYQKHPEVIEFMIDVVKEHNKKAMFGHKLEKYNKEKAIKIREKLYFLYGDHMVATSKSRKESVEILNNGGFEYEIINDAGHAANHEQPEIVNRKIIDFLLRMD